MSDNKEKTNIAQKQESKGYGTVERCISIENTESKKPGYKTVQACIFSKGEIIGSDKQD